MHTMIKTTAAAGLGLALLLGTAGIATAQPQCTPLFPGSSLCTSSVVSPTTPVGAGVTPSTGARVLE